MKALLHPKTAAQLDGLRARPEGSVIFHGPRGLGKAYTARQLAAQLNCTDGQPGACTNCRQLDAGNFPDLHWIERGDKASISIEQVRGLTSELGLKPFTPGATRVVVIDQAHLLTVEAQNALLKLLEEPPPATLIVLLAEDLQGLLVTVRSRCRSVQFIRPGEAAVAELLVSHHGVAGPTAAQLAAASAGAPGTAVNLAARPAEAEALTALTAAAANPASRPVFERLLLAGRLVSSGADLDGFGATLHRRIVTGVEGGTINPATASTWLDALERFRTHLSAKVSPRVALERLMLELG